MAWHLAIVTRPNASGPPSPHGKELVYGATVRATTKHESAQAKMRLELAGSAVGVSPVASAGPRPRRGTNPRKRPLIQSGGACRVSLT